MCFVISVQSIYLTLTHTHTTTPQGLQKVACRLTWVVATSPWLPKRVVRTKRVVDNRGIFRLQQVQSPYVDTWGFSYCIQVRSPYVLLRIVFKVKFTTRFLFFRRKFDFEDDLEENIRRSNLYALGKSQCIYIRRSKLLQRKNPCV